ncbi:MAG: CoB--CoM heterodisulfide reductase iron-sulfur subunit A family protein [Omnitrophica bacterium]|nr:CoB--CoM heterodisulfide reductase iron-sulfur subunit A family protein [Candidatus Omnitrophota bacterium]
MKKRIGVFLCWCGSNIAEVVDVDKVIDTVKNYPAVAHAKYYKYFCSELGQEIIVEAIKKHKLDGVIIAACSPAMHEETFRKAVSRGGLNEYECEIANVREQCSWVHRMQKGDATQKAIKIISSMIEKVKQNKPLKAVSSSLIKRALVIGSGIAGMQAALDIANSGYPVMLVERAPSIGGHMAQLAETFPTLDCSQCIITPKMVEVSQHPKINLLTYSEVQDVSGCVGDFTVKIRLKAAYVDRKKCTGCGLCIEKCPVKVDSEFNQGLGKRKAIYVTSAQAVPNKPVIDSEHCLYLTQGKCQICSKVCEIKAVDYKQKEVLIEEKFGAIIIATGYDLYPDDKLGEYGYGSYKNVISGLEFERLNSASGPTNGEILRPSDGKPAKEVVFIQCIGSRDPENGMPYCSKICCMYTAKHAILYKRKVPDGQAYVFYMDIRSGGKGYEEFVQQGIKEENILYFRGQVSKIFEEDDKIVVWGVDTLTNRKIEIEADLVVLATAIVPRDDAKKLAKLLNVSTDEFGFYREAHVKLRPVESTTRGIFFAGCAQGPKDIPDTISQAGCAANKINNLFSQDKIYSEPMVAYVNEELCRGCGLCVTACPYDAREIDSRKKIAKVTEALCQGCGACVSACPNKACNLKNMTMEQVFRMIDKLE